MSCRNVVHIIRNLPPPTQSQPHLIGEGSCRSEVVAAVLANQRAVADSMLMAAAAVTAQSVAAAAAAGAVAVAGYTLVQQSQIHTLQAAEGAVHALLVQGSAAPATKQRGHRAGTVAAVARTTYHRPAAIADTAAADAVDTAAVDTADTADAAAMVQAVLTRFLASTSRV